MFTIKIVVVNAAIVIIVTFVPRGQKVTLRVRYALLTLLFHTTMFCGLEFCQRVDMKFSICHLITWVKGRAVW